MDSKIGFVVRMAAKAMGPLLLAILPAGAISSDGAGPQHPSRADEALQICHLAEHASGAARAALLREGLRLAEVAVRANDADARAHFAVFCNLGKRVDDEGIRLGSLGAVRRLRGEIDRAMELAPDDADIVAAKGAFLVELPEMLGGDDELGQQLLRRALTLDSDNDGARLYLSRAAAPD